MPTLAALEAAADLVHRSLAPTPERCWPLLAERYGCELWVKHENQTPIGSFKVRGGLVYMDTLRREQPKVTGVIAATRGNHGQSVAFAATRNGLGATVVVPHGNSLEKNRAMRAFGAELIEEGHDFQAAYEHAFELAGTRGLHMVRSFDPTLALGVASYSLELLRAVPDLETLYVPIGLGSGICSAIAVRDALGCKTAIVGVVAEAAPTRPPTPSPSPRASRCRRRPRTPSPTGSPRAFPTPMRWPSSSRAPRAHRRRLRGRHAGLPCATTSLLQPRAGQPGLQRGQPTRGPAAAPVADTHNLAEGAGAATLAAVGLERGQCAGRRVGVILSGGNIDVAPYREILAEAA